LSNQALSLGAAFGLANLALIAMFGDGVLMAVGAVRPTIVGSVFPRWCSAFSCSKVSSGVNSPGMSD
jgi:hypothetical protein